jgi:hypothetical protein
MSAAARLTCSAAVSASIAASETPFWNVVESVWRSKIVYAIRRLGAFSITRFTAARAIPTCGPASTSAATGMNEDRYRTSSLNSVAYSLSSAAGTEMIR